MERGIPALDAAYTVFFSVILCILAAMVLLCLVRAIIGPRVADRIVATNMMGTIVMVIIAILAVMLGEGYLVDICLIYAMISFLAVIVLTKVYMGVYQQKKQGGESGFSGNGKAAEAGRSSQNENGAETGSTEEKEEP